MKQNNLLVELLVEELPPKALKKLGDAFAGVLFDQLKTLDLTAADSIATAFASPRRLGAHISHVSRKAPDLPLRQKLMPLAVGLDAAGQPTPALLKKLAALGADLSDPHAAVAALERAPDGKGMALYHCSLANGATLDIGLQDALDQALAQLPIPKVMSYQLHHDCGIENFLPGWSSVHFVRPAQALVALHGSTVLPVRALGLTAGRRTQGHRFEARQSPLLIADADSYAQTLLTEGAVIASFDDRRFAIVQQLAQAAERLGPLYQVQMDEALLDEVTALVERPQVLTCSFEEQFLDVPQECLILTMKANQKYFPLLNTHGKLTHKFLVVSNIFPADPSAVIGGNERVVRARLADAKFFFDQDRKKTLAARVAGLDQVVYHHKLGSLGDRMQRVRAIASAIGQQLGGAALAHNAATAAQLAKTDLLTDMVGEFPELQGIMGGYYARHDGLNEEIACAIEDHYKPRFAGDTLARGQTGLVLALADKLETLVGMFGIGNLPSGDKDPFALRRHALGVIRMLVEKDLPLELNRLLADAALPFGTLIDTPGAALAEFIGERLASALREQGFRAQEVDAVLALQPQRLADVTRRLQAVRDFAALPEAPALAAANKRIGNILKKSDAAPAALSARLLVEPAEHALFAAMQASLPSAQLHFDAGHYTAALAALAALRAPVDAFFDTVLVNTDDAALKANRLALLQRLHQAMNRVADLSRLA